ncbi:MAG: response regulator [Planctomycetota bacterium]
MYPVLLVEDEAGIREALSSFLRMRGFEVRVASTLREAIVDLDARPPCILVTDERLPDGSGRNLIDRMLQGGQRLPCLLLSADPPDAITAWIQERDGVDFLPKPVQPARLAAWLKERVSPEPQEHPAEASRLPIRLLEKAGLGPEEVDRCVLAFLPFAGRGSLLEVRREEARVRLLVGLEGSDASPREPCHSLPGVDIWPIQRGSGEEPRFAVLVDLPWRGSLGADVLDLASGAGWRLERILAALEEAKERGQSVVNLASWHRLGLELLGRTDLLPRVMSSASPETQDERRLLWSEPAMTEKEGSIDG